MADVKHLTLCFIYDSEKVLLAMKKRGFGEGWWNGYGGKLDEGETIEAAAIRELEEESGIRAKEIEKRGFLVFTGEDEADFYTHIFHVVDYEGDLIETEEMKPEWFAHHEIPYDDMWPDDKYWMPIFLEGDKFEGRFHIVNKKIENYEIKKVDSLS